MLPIAAVLDGMSWADAARAGGMERQSLRERVHQLIDLPYIQPLIGDDEEGVLSPFFNEPTYVSPSRIRQPGNDSPGSRPRTRGFDTEWILGRPSAPHFHSWTHYFWQAQEVWPNLYAQVHPEKAKQHGIADGANADRDGSWGD